MGSVVKPRPLDLSHETYLSGVFAPVLSEVDHDDLEVEGRIPDDLIGAYLRNGPNPMFPPLGSYTYPLDGDSMIHGIWLEDGRARYRNRYVMTRGLEAEKRAGRALWGGVMSPMIQPEPDLLGPDPDPDGKLLPDIHVIRHGGHYLALGESSPPYEISADLATLGRYEFGGQLPEGICAHPRIDPVTGEMVVFRYGFMEAPWLEWATVGPDGRVTHGPDPIDLDAGYMIHDFVITEEYAVLFINPVLIDLTAAIQGQNPLAWKPELGTRIAVIPRAGTSKDVRWFETEAFFAWHWANAYQDGNQIVVHYPSWSHFSLGAPGASAPEAHVACARLDLVTGTASLEKIDDRKTEFPRIDDRLQARRHRWMTLSHKSGRVEGLVGGEFDELLRYDLDSGTVASHRFGNAVIGEAAFAPKGGQQGEDEGYLMAFVNDLATEQSSFVILDVDDIAAEPVATIKLPTRVPQGLHGSWFPAEG